MSAVLQNDRLTPYLVAPSDIGVVWPSVAPLLDRAIAMNGCLDLDDVRSLMERGDMQLLVVADDAGDVVAALATEVCQYPKVRALRIVLAGGERLDEWIDQTHDFIEQGARQVGATIIEIIGRGGWLRKLARKNYFEVFTTIQRVVGAEQ